MNNNVGKRPKILCFAGPNGSGKSTIMRNLSVFGTYINADNLKMEYNFSDLEAAKYAESLRNELVNRRADFSFETVLSTDRNLKLLQKAKDVGYEIECIYVLTCNVNINVARVKERVLCGGHDVPEIKIRMRYQKAMKLIPLLIAITDKILIFDNSLKPTLIFKKDNGLTENYPNKLWGIRKIKALTKN
jgi:predicted ABC-type ATPase